MSRFRLLIGIVAGLILIVPVAAVAATSLFDDVDDANPFVEDINWMKTSEVSNGCNPEGTNYCPEDFVTRQQMAAFLNRLAENQVVDAATVEGKTAADLQGSAGPLVFEESEPGYYGSNGLPEGEAASLATLTFNAPSAGIAVITGHATVESPGLGIQGQMWIEAGSSANTCTYDSDIAADRGVGTVKTSATNVTPSTTSLSATATVSAGSNTVDLCTSVIVATAADPANQRGVYRFRNIVVTFVPTAP